MVESVADALRRRRAFRHVCEENERPIDIARRFNVDAKELVRLNKRWYESLTQLALLREEGNRSLMREAVRRSRDETPNEAAGAAAGAV